MRQGVFLEHCQLLDDHDQPVLEPFREAELWNEERDRLTLWLHPGRQKTGVNLNTEFGPVLQPGRRYRLVISGSWPSEDGVPLGKNVEKQFFVTERVTQQLDIHSWKINPPAAEGRGPLEVEFPAPLDHALLMRCLHVMDERGRTVAGAATSARDETVWRFVPTLPWQGGRYALTADTILEDLAGNSLARPFEVDITATPPKKTGPVLRWEFTVNP
jgi:hypothetical protein